MTDAPRLGPAELARRAGVSKDTLRHYERLGLLPGTTRTIGGYRRYAADAVGRVRRVQRALAIGFSHADLARVFRERDRGGAPCRAVRSLVAARLTDLDDRIGALIDLRTDLRRLLADWDARLAATPPGARAHLLDSLKDADRPLRGVAHGKRRGP
jgi:DNA-binding transcriptional MerR regulator